MRLTRRGRLTVTLGVTTLVLAAACTTYGLTRPSIAPALGLGSPPPCRITVGDTHLDWTRERAMSATTVAAVGRRLGARDDAVAAAVSRTLARPPAHVVDVVAARALYHRLPERPRPSPRELAVASALLGREGDTLTCEVTPRADLLPAERPGPNGLTPRADALRDAMRETFGRQVLGGFDAGGVRSGHVEGSAHYEGRAVDVFFRPVTAAHQELGWEQAQWAVAHADRLRVATVIFDRRIWSAEHSSRGWRTYVYPDGPTEDAVLLHEDHVHVDVLRGSDST